MDAIKRLCGADGGSVAPPVVVVCRRGNDSQVRLRTLPPWYDGPQATSRRVWMEDGAPPAWQALTAAKDALCVNDRRQSSG